MPFHAPSSSTLATQARAAMIASCTGSADEVKQFVDSLTDEQVINWYMHECM